MRTSAVPVALAALLALPASPATSQPDSAKYGAAYFRQLLDKEGAEGIHRRLYVAPPELMSPLLSGIATGSPEWLDVYDRFRKGLDARARSGPTGGRLDDALADALSVAPERVLSYLRDHEEPTVREICARGSSDVDESSLVFEPREVLMMVRRQRVLADLKRRDLSRERSACLAATSERLRRQLRIYLVSFGAPDAKSAGSRKLSEAERRELDAAVAAARKDPAVSARRDGALPDGPFRTKDVPRDAAEACAGQPVAAPEGPWEFTDVIEDNRPRARLLSACHVAADEWDLSCEIGGFSPYFRHVRVRKIEGTWKAAEGSGGRVPRHPTPAPEDIWPDCAKLRPLPAATAPPGR